MTDISDTLAPNSSQLDNVELANGPRTFTVDRVVVKKGAEQPVDVFFVEFPRPWRPGKNMRRVLGHCWTNDSSTWPGRRVRLFRDPDVTFGRDVPGGTRISHLSDIDGPIDVPILVSQGRMGTYHVDPLPDAPTPPSESAIACATDKSQLLAWGQQFPSLRPALKARMDELDGEPTEGGDQ